MSPKSIIIITIAAVAILAVVLIAANVPRQTGVTGVSNTPSGNNTAVKKSDVPVDFNNKIVVKANKVENGTVVTYNFYDKVKTISGSELTLNSNVSGLPTFSITDKTKILKTTTKQQTPATIADIKPELWVYVNAYYVIKDDRWVTTDVWIPLDYQGPLPNK